MTSLVREQPHVPAEMSAKEIELRREIATDSLAAWRKERPVSSHHSDLKDAKVAHYESELRYIATIDALREHEKQLREYAQMALNHWGDPNCAKCKEIKDGLAELLAAKEGE